MSQPSRRRLYNETNGETGRVGDDQVSQWVKHAAGLTTHVPLTTLTCSLSQQQLCGAHGAGTVCGQSRSVRFRQE